MGRWDVLEVMRRRRGGEGSSIPSVRRRSGRNPRRGVRRQGSWVGAGEVGGVTVEGEVRVAVGSQGFGGTCHHGSRKPTQEGEGQGT